MRDLSRQSDPQLAPADGSDCKYLFYTVFYQIFNRKMGKNVQASRNTDRNMGQGPERLNKDHNYLSRTFEFRVILIQTKIMDRNLGSRTGPFEFRPKSRILDWVIKTFTRITDRN